MKVRALRALVWAASMSLVATSASAQSTPTPAQAQALLQSRPELAGQIRQRIQTSGMTPDQIRTRLRAEGYSESMLDQYLPGASGGGAAPSSEVLGALERLGIANTDDAAVMRTMLRQGQNPDTVRIPRVRDDSVRAEADEEKAQELFGLSLFQNATSEFVPVLDGPVDDDYRLGPGDELVLILTGEVELAHTLPLTREGFIVIPQVGQLSVAGLTMTQLESLLYTRLARSYSGVARGANARTKFSVSVSRLRAIQVFVTGDVTRPASYRVASTSTAMTALYAAGGPTENGTFRAVTVRRGGRAVATLDIYDYLLRGERGSDVRLENGDIVFVAPHGPRVRVVGEVLRPATYELKAGEGVREALAAAGGFRATALTSRVAVTRVLPPAERVAGGRDRVVVDVANAGDGRVQSFPALELHGGDELRVFPVTDRVRGLVRISGQVWNPGPQGHRPGLTLSAALRAAGGLRSDAYLGQVSVTRLRPDSTRAQLRATLRDTTGALVEDMVLQEDDEVTVFSLTEFRPERYVAIGGSVRKSGQFPWRAGMTLRDLVLEAGGLTEDAYLREAEVARVPEDRSGGRTANTLRVPLDSSYIGDYVPGQAYPRTPGETAAGFRTQPEVELQPYDNVLIMQRPDWQPPRSVVLTGEVRFPGRYTLVSKSERLSEVVRRAGGLTEDASADAAFFGRVVSATSFKAATERGDELALEERLAYGRTSGALALEEDSMPPELERTRVGLDLRRALTRGRSADNLVLFGGDSLHVPFRRTTVEIQGAVNAPSIITHSGRRIGYYLSAAGGSSASGNERRAYVIQPNGKIESRRRLVWVIALDPKPREGATVVVPASQDNGEGVQRIANTVQIIAQMLASVATLVVLLR